MFTMKNAKLIQRLFPPLQVLELFASLLCLALNEVTKHLRKEKINI